MNTDINRNTTIIRGKVVSLRPLTPEDKELFYLWATQSEGTPFWYSERTGEKIPTRKEFFDDFADHYFDGTQPLKGRSYAIRVNETGRESGQIFPEGRFSDKGGV